MAEFRAPVIVGSGSLSFEIITYLTELLPVMICPRWLYTRAQPIAVRNVLDYLLAALDTPESTGLTIEIGGVDVLISIRSGRQYVLRKLALENALIRGRMLLSKHLAIGSWP